MMMVIDVADDERSLEALPQYVLLPSSGELIIIRRGTVEEFTGISTVSFEEEEKTEPASSACESGKKTLYFLASL